MLQKQTGCVREASVCSSAQVWKKDFLCSTEKASGCKQSECCRGKCTRCNIGGMRLKKNWENIECAGSLCDIAKECCERDPEFEVNKKGVVTGIVGGGGSKVDLGLVFTNSKVFENAKVLEVYNTIRNVSSHLCLSSVYRFPKVGAGRGEISKKLDREMNAKEHCMHIDDAEAHFQTLGKVQTYGSVKVLPLTAHKDARKDLNHQRSEGGVAFEFGGYRHFFHFKKGTALVVRRVGSEVGKTEARKEEGSFWYEFHKKLCKNKATMLENWKELEDKMTSPKLIMEGTSVEKVTLKIEKQDGAVVIIRITINISGTEEKYYFTEKDGKRIEASNRKAGKFLKNATLLGVDAALNKKFKDSLVNLNKAKDTIKRQKTSRMKTSPTPASRTLRNSLSCCFGSCSCKGSSNLELKT